jgi:diaminopropionate ammonia-lyase
LLESAKQGKLARITGAPTSLGRLDCKEPSLIALDILSALADAFMTIKDTDAEDAALQLTNNGAPVSACGAAGAAGLIIASQDDSARRLLDLHSSSHVLLIGTEGPQA